MCTSCWKGTSPSGPVNLCHLDLSHLWHRREDQTPIAQAVVWLRLWFGSSAAPSFTTWEEGPGAGTYMCGHTGSQTRHMQHTQPSSCLPPSSLHTGRLSHITTAEMCPTTAPMQASFSLALSSEGQAASSGPAKAHALTFGSLAFFCGTRGYHSRMAAHACNPSTQKVELGSSGVQG